jgi:hypothetical protein
MPHHFLLITGSMSTYRIALYILIQILMGIQIRTVIRKIKDLNAILILFEPLLHFACYMNRMLINNQKHIPRDLTGQSPQKLHKHLGLKPMLEDHEVQLSTIRNGRNHITSKLLARPWNLVPDLL